MSALLVAYQIRSAVGNRWKISETIKASSNGWWHYIENVWIVNTTDTANDFALKLYPYIHREQDSLFVVRITKEFQGWLPQEAWDWLKVT